MESAADASRSGRNWPAEMDRGPRTETALQRGGARRRGQRRGPLKSGLAADVDPATNATRPRERTRSRGLRAKHCTEALGTRERLSLRAGPPPNAGIFARTAIMRPRCAWIRAADARQRACAARCDEIFAADDSYGRKDGYEHATTEHGAPPRAGQREQSDARSGRRPQRPKARDTRRPRKTRKFGQKRNLGGVILDRLGLGWRRVTWVWRALLDLASHESRQWGAAWAYIPLA